MVIPVLLTLLLVVWNAEAQYNTGVGTTIQVGTTQPMNAVAMPQPDSWSCNCRKGANTITMAIPDSTLTQYGLSQYIVRPPQQPGIVSVHVQQPGFGMVQTPSPAPVPVPLPQPTPPPMPPAPQTPSVTNIELNIKPEQERQRIVVPPAAQGHVAIVPSAPGFIETLQYRLPPLGIDFKWGNRLCKCQDVLLSGLPEATLATLVSYNPMDTSDKSDGKDSSNGAQSANAAQSLKTRPDLSASNTAQTFNQFQNSNPVQALKTNPDLSSASQGPLYNQFSQLSNDNAAQTVNTYPAGITMRQQQTTAVPISAGVSTIPANLGTAGAVPQMIANPTAGVYNQSNELTSKENATEESQNINFDERKITNESSESNQSSELTSKENATEESQNINTDETKTTNESSESNQQDEEQVSEIKLSLDERETSTKPEKMTSPVVPKIMRLDSSDHHAKQKESSSKQLDVETKETATAITADKAEHSEPSKTLEIFLNDETMENADAEAVVQKPPTNAVQKNRKDSDKSVAKKAEASPVAESQATREKNVEAENSEGFLRPQTIKKAKIPKVLHFKIETNGTKPKPIIIASEDKDLALADEEESVTTTTTTTMVTTTTTEAATPSDTTTD